VDIYSKRNFGKIALSFILFISAVAIGLFAFSSDMNQTVFSTAVVCALLLLACSIWAFYNYFERQLLLHVDEEGVLTMYQFYLPWEYIESFYIKDDAFLEIKLYDNDKYVAEMDPDIHAAYYDEIEVSNIHGHELFFFPVTFMDLECDAVLSFFNTALKKYKKK